MSQGDDIVLDVKGLLKIDFLAQHCQSKILERIPSGLVVMTLAYRTERRGFESAARRMLLSQKGFEYVTMKPPLPVKAVGPQPANVPLRNEV